MKKFLIVAHYSRFLLQFEQSNVEILQKMGYEVHYATNYQQEDMFLEAPDQIRQKGVQLHQIDFVRQPHCLWANFRAYGQLVELMRRESFEGIHCHTPMAGVLARLAAKKMGIQPVFYTAHGFHFYKGCPFQNRLIYKTAERWMARYTDALITINEEDYQAAKQFPVRGKAYRIPGVGVDTQTIGALMVDREEKRRSLGIPPDSFVCVSVGELNANKNHRTAIRAFQQANLPGSCYLICGEGELHSLLEEQIAQSGLKDRVKLLGFRNDVAEILKCADLFLFPSFREGLGLAAVEALAAGLPVIAAENRGSREYFDPRAVLLCPADSVDAWAAAIREMADRCRDGRLAGAAAAAAKRFDRENVVREMKKIYQEYLG